MSERNSQVLLSPEPSNFEAHSSPQPSIFANRVKTEYDHYLEHITWNSESPKPPIDLSTADHVKYPHYTPHNFLTQDMSKRLYEFGTQPNMELKDNQEVRELILSKIKPKQKRLNKESIILTQSEETAHEVLIRSMCEPGDSVIVGAPGNPK